MTFRGCVKILSPSRRSGMGIETENEQLVTVLTVLLNINTNSLNRGERKQKTDSSFAKALSLEFYFTHPLANGPKSHFTSSTNTFLYQHNFPVEHGKNKHRLLIVHHQVQLHSSPVLLLR